MTATFIHPFTGFIEKTFVITEFELRVVELETERLDEVQHRFCGRAQPRHVAGVRRDFRFNQNYVH